MANRSMISVEITRLNASRYAQAHGMIGRTFENYNLMAYAARMRPVD